MMRRTFPCEPKAVPAARRFVRESLDGHPTEQVEAVEVMASELATNCIRHAGTAFEVAVEAGAEVRVEVRDDGGGKPTPRSPEPQEPTGRGLLIVQSMALDWGVIPTAEGKTVWFTVGRSQDADGGARSEGADERDVAGASSLRGAGRPSDGLSGMFGHVRGYAALRGVRAAIATAGPS